ncbi:MAG TPA: hypothetical protein PKA03_05040 [Tabrizicola sp.]|nr:hypothetical protein [Tabrizicola sp.]
MIRAHLATFPPRAGILMEAIQSILPQVDRLCVCLNGYTRVPPELGDLQKVETLIPDRDLKDAGKFAFPVAADDLVFTIDDDIRYPKDYVSGTVRVFDEIDPATNVLGHLGHALVPKAASGTKGWRNYPFGRRVAHRFKVDVLGTGTACQLGALVPSLEEMRSSAGFVDLRHARLHHLRGRTLWVLPHEDGEFGNLMTDSLWESSLFRTVNRAGLPEMKAELLALYPVLSPFSGMKWEKVVRERAAGARAG